MDVTLPMLGQCFQIGVKGKDGGVKGGVSVIVNLYISLFSVESFLFLILDCAASIDGDTQFTLTENKIATS